MWQRWWFLTLAALVIAAGAHWLYRTRVARLLALERVRTRIATDLHDDLGSNLSQIAILSEVLHLGVGREDRATAKLLSLITTTANESVESMSDIVWAINPKGDSLQNLIRRMRQFASDGFTARNIDFEFRAPEVDRDVEMGADFRREVYLLFKEAVNNVIRHSKCTRAEIETQLEGDDLSAPGQRQWSGLRHDARRRWPGAREHPPARAQSGGHARVDLRTRQRHDHRPAGPAQPPRPSHEPYLRR